MRFLLSAFLCAVLPAAAQNLPEHDLPSRPDSVPEEPFSPMQEEIPKDSIVPDHEMPREISEEMRLPDDLPEVLAPGEASTAVEIMPGVIVESDLPAVPGDKRVEPSARPAQSDPEIVREDPTIPRPEAGRTWYLSPTQARKASRALQKPMLVFFSSMWDSPDSPTVQLNNDLFGTAEFRAFSRDSIIPLWLKYPTGSPKKEEYPEAKLEVLARLKKFCGVRGYPTVVVFDPGGKEIARLNGYGRYYDGRTGKRYSAGSAALYKIKEAVDRWNGKLQADKENRERLKAQGFRVWRSTAGSSLTARYIDAGPAGVTIMDEKGKHLRVTYPQLSLLDREWVKRKTTAPAPPPPDAGTPPDSADKEVARAPDPAMAEPARP